MSKKDLLKEELKRHMQLLEYTFYMPETDYDEEEEGVDNLLLGAEKLYEQDPIPGDEEAPLADAPIPTPEGEEVIDDTTIEEPVSDVDPFAADEGGLEIEDEFADEEIGGDETVEVDVTDIVDKAEETRNEIEGLTSKMEELLGNFDQLSDQVTGMDQLITKIEDLEKEIEKRNPTPVEKLEMISLDSFPYSIKLTDYWSDKEGYENGEEKEEKDYILTQQDVDDYSENEIKNSFDYDDNDENY